MVSIAHRRRGAGRRVVPADHGGAPVDGHAALVLSPSQQEYLTAHGFGPDAPHADFGDPAVRTRFVQLLRECGALAPSPAASRPASGARRHLRRAG